MAFQNNPIHTSGNLPAAGQAAPVFTPTAVDLSDKTFADFVGKCRVLNIFPSAGTDVCAQSVRTFNERASSLDNAVVLCISADLPFAQARFYGVGGLDKVVTLSSFRSSFAADYDIALTDSPLRGLAARVALVLDKDDKVLHSGLVTEITNEPNYDAASTVS